MTRIDRLLRKVSHDSMTGCWIWRGVITPKGYGQVRFNKITYLAHRVSWELHYGEIHSELCVLHKCDVPACVNPDHLFLGNQQDNMLDRHLKNRQARGERIGNSKLTADSVKEIKRRCYIPRSMARIARQYGVTQGTIAAIIHGRTWQHVVT